MVDRHGKNGDDLYPVRVQYFIALHSISQIRLAGKSVWIVITLLFVKLNHAVFTLRYDEKVLKIGLVLYEIRVDDLHCKFFCGEITVYSTVIF